MSLTYVGFFDCRCELCLRRKLLVLNIQVWLACQEGDDSPVKCNLGIGNAWRELCYILYKCK